MRQRGWVRKSVPAVGIASGLGFPDALSGSAHLARLGGPLLLSHPKALPKGTTAYIRDHDHRPDVEDRHAVPVLVGARIR